MMRMHVRRDEGGVFPAAASARYQETESLR